MKLAVTRRALREPARPWRSVVVRTKLKFDRPTSRQTMRELLQRVAKQHGVPRQRTRVVELTGSGSCLGYFHIYRGEPTPSEQTLFNAVLETVTALDLTEATVETILPEEDW